jgi:hypothetical protein
MPKPVPRSALGSTDGSRYPTFEETLDAAGWRRTALATVSGTAIPLTKVNFRR